MGRPRIQYRIAEADFAEFAELLGHDEFPESYEELLQEQQAQKEASQYLEVVDVYPGAFKEYCSRSGLVANLSTLGAFAVCSKEREEIAKIGR